MLTGFITGHCTLRRHLGKLGIAESSMCWINNLKEANMPRQSVLRGSSTLGNHYWCSISLNIDRTGCSGSLEISDVKYSLEERATLSRILCRMNKFFIKRAIITTHIIFAATCQ